MDAMDTYYAIVGASGEIEIPEPLCASLGIVDDTRVALRIEGGSLILEPVNETRCDLPDFAF
jgi:antitoxin component of MazEF toxin-antitoxin module